MSTSTGALRSSSPLPSSSSSKRACYNTCCTDVVSERPRNGWRLCTGEYAELCDRCACAYEEGKFCEKFHWNASGWRCCQACGKRVHCGCIVSANEFTLLDPGGIQCMMCARKNVILPPNPTWPSSLFFHSPLPDRVKDLPGKIWSQLAGSGPVPWRQAPTLFNYSLPTSELQQVEMKTGVNKINSTEKMSVLSLDKRKPEDFSERFLNGSLNDNTREIHESGVTGIKCNDQPSSCTNIAQQSVPMKEESSTTPFGLTQPYASPNESNSQNGISGMHSRIPLPPTQKQFCGNILSDQPSEAQIRNGRARGDPRGKNNLLPRYWPRFTDQELHQISVDTNSVITPLFEKMLSASDAGRIGRLVLPKKCAEAYFPPISQPEGLPLKVQDAKGKEWIFQFRFWPNNNSRMYVLEGVTPCIQSMQLQAGDIVTFSRLEPEGKLVMGFRKASAVQDQEIETNKTGNGVSTNGEAEKADPSLWTKVDKSGYIAKEVLGAKSSISRKRKNNSASGSKSKRLKIESGDMIEVKITWEEAQGLFRPPLDYVPSVVVIEGVEFEEYEDAPILGRPTIIPPDNSGEKIQWAQCEDCFKWRKLPVDALLPLRFTCSANSWEPNRSFCTADQELTKEQIEALLTPSNSASASKKLKAAKPDTDGIEALEGLDTLENLAILDEGESVQASSSQATTKHPRHRPGCSCIVCIQPPSGKGPKHKQTCTCNVCLTVKRRFKTLMMRREKKQSEKELEPTRKKQQKRQDKSLDDESLLCNSTTNSSPSQKRGDANDGSDDEPSRINNNKSSTSSPFKGQIDLNIQPERDEELSPGSDSVPMMKLVKDAEILLRQKRLLSSSNGSGSGSGENSSKNGTDLDNNRENSEKGLPSTFTVKSSASILGTG